MLEWFDYIFNRLVNERSLIKKSEDGVLHYVIHRFDEDPADVEWLKSNLPNILTQAEQTEIANYDNSFADGKAGQVASFNHPVSENRLLEAFKKYRWLSISSEIVEQQEITSGDSIEIELNFEELNRKLNEFNQHLLPIAVNISEGSYADLKRMTDEVQEISTSLVKYLPTIDDPEEKEKFGRLDSKYYSLKGTIETLLSKFTASTESLPLQAPKQETQYCFSCKQNKLLSHFRSPDATKCLECEEQDRRKSEAGTNVIKGYKTCISCGKEKPDRFFNQTGTDICDDCAKEQKVQKVLFEKLGKILTSKGFLGRLVLIAIVVVGVVFAAKNFPNGYSIRNVFGGGGEKTDTARTDVTITGETIDEQKLKGLIESGDFEAVYGYVKDKEDTANYKLPLKQAVQQYLKSIVDMLQSSKEGVLESFDKFYVDNFQFLDFINFGTQDKEYWKQFANDYFYVWDLIKKTKITQDEKDKGNEILTKYVGHFPEDWMNRLANVEVETPKPVVITKTDGQSETTTPGAISVSYTSSNNNLVNENITGNREIFIKEGTLVTFNYPNGNIRTKEEASKKKNGKKNKRDLQPKKRIIVYCGEIGITITPAEKNRFKE